MGRYNVTAAAIKLLRDTATAPREAPIRCPHWSPGSLTLRKGCTACAADSRVSGMSKQTLAVCEQGGYWVAYDSQNEQQRCVNHIGIDHNHTNGSGQ